MREPLQVRSGFDRPNLSFDVVPLEGHGLEGAAAGAARGGPGRPGQPAGDRLLRHPQGHRRGRGDAARGRPARRSLPRRHGSRGAHLDPAPLHGRRGRGDRRHQRLRDGRRQGRRALGLAHGDPDQRRGLLPGGRPRRARRPAGQGGAAGDEGRPRPPGPLQRTAQPATPSWRSPTSAAGAPTTRSNPSSTRERCRRRSLLDHFGDRTAGAPLEPLLRRLRPARAGCPTRRRSRSAASAARKAAGGPAARPLPRRRAALRGAEGLAPEAAAGKPAYTVAHNRTLPRSPRSGPTTRTASIAISGVGPSFISKYAPEVLALVAEYPAPLAA